MDNFYEMYKDYDGIDVDDLTHIPEISHYNHNYYIGLKRKGVCVNDLILAISDDDNLTHCYHIKDGCKIHIGYQKMNEGFINVINELF